MNLQYLVVAVLKSVSVNFRSGYTFSSLQMQVFTVVSGDPTVHDHPLYLVCPDLLVAVGETSYGIRLGFIGSDEFLTTFLLFVSEMQSLNFFSFKQKTYSNKRKSNRHFIQVLVTCCFK